MKWNFSVENAFSFSSYKKALLWLSVPATIGMFFESLYNLLDMSFVGHQLGVDNIAAISLCFPYFLIIMTIGLMLSVGGSSIISRAIGREDTLTVEKTVSSILFYSILLGLLIWILTSLFSTQMAQFLGAKDTLLPLVKIYLSLVSIGFIFSTPGVVLQGILQAKGQSILAMNSGLAGSVSNILLDILLLYVFKMDIVGVALANILAQIIFLTYTIWIFIESHNQKYIKMMYLWGDKEINKEILAIGFPSLIRKIANSAVMILSNHVLVFYGSTLSVALFGIIGRVEQLQLYLVFGLARGMKPLVGFYFAKKAYQKLRKSFDFTLSLSLVINIFIAAICTFFPVWSLSFFTSDTSLYDYGKDIFRLVQVLSPVLVINTLSVSLFQSLGDGKRSLWLTLVRPIIMSMVIFILLPFLEEYSLWWSFFITNILSGIYMSYIVYRWFFLQKKVALVND